MKSWTQCAPVLHPDESFYDYGNKPHAEKSSTLKLAILFGVSSDIHTASYIIRGSTPGRFRPIRRNARCWIWNLRSRHKGRGIVRNHFDIGKPNVVEHGRTAGPVK